MNQENLNNWRLTKFKFVGDIISGGTPESGKVEYWDGPVPWLTPVDLGKNGSDVIYGSARTITTAGVKAAGLAILPHGSIVVSTRAPIGSVGLLACEATTNQGCKALVPDKSELDSKFSYYFSLDAAQELQSLGLGTTFIELSTYSLKNLRLRIPSTSHQRRIAAYLDEQTTKIDRLMEMRRRQMELLKEQRSALIQQAVTRGLNPDAPMKGSGNTWLPEIPDTWSSVKLKYLGKFVSGYAFDSKDFTDTGVRVIKIANIQTMRLDWEEESFLPESYLQKYSNFIVSDGDLVFALTRPVISTGLKAAIADIKEERVLLNQRNAVFKPNKRVKREFLYYAVFSRYFVTDFVSRIDDTGQQPNISPIELADIQIALPSLSVQVEIVEWIRSEETKTNNLIDSYIRQLTLLAEYRAALIHECVTGQREV